MSFMSFGFVIFLYLIKFLGISHKFFVCLNEHLDSYFPTIFIYYLVFLYHNSIN